MAAIGDISFITIKGTPRPMGMETEPLTRPGVDGTAFRELGTRGQPFQVTTIVDVDDAADAKTALESYAALRATLVTLTDDLGNSWANVMVIDVEPIEVKAVESGVGGLSQTGGVLVSARWTLQCTE